MKIQIHNGLRDAQTLPVTRVLLLDDFDNPLFIAVQTDPGVIILEQATEQNEAQFNAVLRNLGINNTVIVREASQRDLRDINISG